MDGSWVLVLSGSLFAVSIGALGLALYACEPAVHSASELAQSDEHEDELPRAEAAVAISSSGKMGSSMDTAPLTGKQPEGAPPRCIHPTSISGGRDRIAPVVATGLHWPRVLDHTAPVPDCEPVAAWQWLQRSWGLFIICWAGCLAILVTFDQIRSAAEAPEPSGLVSSLDVLLWTSSCRAGLTCFGWAVLATVAVLLVLVGYKGARHPWPLPLLMVFSPLEDVNLGIVFGGSSFALEAATIFFGVLIGIVAWTSYHLARARKTQEHLGCSWGSAAAVGCAISIVGAAAAVAIDVATDRAARYGVHGESVRPARCADGLLSVDQCCPGAAALTLAAGCLARTGAACGGSIGLTLLVVFQTRELAGLCGAEEHVLPGLFLFLPPQALTWWESRRVAR